MPESVIKKGFGRGDTRKYDIPTETMKLLFLNIKSIDKKEYMEYVNDQIDSGKMYKRKNKR